MLGLSILHYSRFIKSFLIVLYLINSLFKRKSIYKLTKESIKIFKVSYFSFSFKLNEKKRVSLKIWFGDEGYKKLFAEWGFLGEADVGRVTLNETMNKWELLHNCVLILCLLGVLFLILNLLDFNLLYPFSCHKFCQTFMIPHFINTV